MQGSLASRARQLVKRVTLRGEQRYCPVCGGTARMFLDAGTPRRPDARCPWCNSLERHRLVWRYFQNRTNLFDGQSRRVLHVAPEPCFEPRLRAELGDNYWTADLHDPQVRERMDITSIPHPDATFDIIYCSHVLEHILEDRQAMAELFRVLKPDGWAVLLVPIGAETTFEDPSVILPQERLRLFGQEDHVRVYGRDYPDRLRDAGFQVREVAAEDFLCDQAAVRLGVTGPAAGTIFACTK